MTRSLGIRGLLIGLGAMVAACSHAPADSPSTAASAGGRGNACQLLDKEDMERLHGAPVTMLHNIEADDRTTCEVYDAASNQAFFYLEVLWRGGSETAKAEGTARGIAAGMLGDRNVNLEPLTGASAGAKAADSAYYSDVAPSWVLKGDVLLRFKMAGLTQDQRAELRPARAKGAGAFLTEGLRPSDSPTGAWLGRVVHLA
jgi:hypothetical protein